MTVELLESPAEPVVDDDGSYGGYADIARVLSAQQPDRERPFSRQLVHRWYLRRGYNGFPESQQVRTKTGKVRTMFSMEAVEAWHRSYRAHHRERRQNSPIETIPLFNVGMDGQTIW